MLFGMILFEKRVISLEGDRDKSKMYTLSPKATTNNKIKNDSK